MGVAALHCAFVAVLGSGANRDASLERYTGPGAAWSRLHPGFGSNIPPDLFLLSLFWSLMFGLALLTVGLLVNALERAEVAVPRSVSVGLFAASLFGAACAPASGFWFVLLIAASLLRRP